VRIGCAVLFLFALKALPAAEAMVMVFASPLFVTLLAASNNIGAHHQASFGSSFEERIPSSSRTHNLAQGRKKNPAQSAGFRGGGQRSC
jgi:hypothetical protein